MRPRYLQRDFVLVALGAIVAALIAIWVTKLGIHGGYAIAGFVVVLWLLLDVLQRRLIREGMAAEERGLAKRSATPRGEVIDWPPLPVDAVPLGRAATQADVNQGRAVFVMNELSGKPGEPVSMPLPQYGLVDSTPVAVFQAETDGVNTFVGFMDLESSSLDFASIHEVTLLGARRPPSAREVASSESQERNRDR
jgi:hypothetical protein